MGFTNAAMKFFTGVEEQEENVNEYKGPRLLETEHLNIMMRTPKSFADVRGYADSLMSGSAILISFDSVEPALRNRIFDYLNGVSYIVNASVSAVTPELLLYTPERVEITKEKATKKRSILG